MVSTYSCSQFRPSKKYSNSTKLIELYSRVSEQIKPLKPIGQVAPLLRSSLSPSSSRCRSSGKHSRRLFQKTIEGYCCKINGYALGAAALRHSLGGSDERAQTQGVSESAAVVHWSLSKNMIGSKPVVLNRILCKAAEQQI